MVETTRPGETAPLAREVLTIMMRETADKLCSVKTGTAADLYGRNTHHNFSATSHRFGSLVFKRMFHVSCVDDFDQHVIDIFQNVAG